MIFLVQFGINKHLLIFSRSTNSTGSAGLVKHTTYFTVKLQGLIPPIDDDIINKLLRIWFRVNESFPPQKILICLH